MIPNTPRNRIAASLLSLSAAGLVSWAAYEGYRDTAFIPVPGDPPTIGFGDAQGVRPGQKTTPVRALIRLGQQMNAFQEQLHRCIGDVPLYQWEWDAYVDLAGNIGAARFCNSSTARLLKTGAYATACESIHSTWTWLHGRNCALPENRKRKDGCAGIMNRREKEYRTCIGVGSALAEETP